MEKFLKQQEKERMKRAMLQQEEAFKQQVHELHRLYQVQKQLMREAKTNKLTKNWILRDTNPARPKELLDLKLTTESYVKNSVEDMEQESEIELTLATGSRREKREASTSSVSAASYSSSSVESGGLKLLGHEWGNKKLPWFLPCLSLTMS